MQSFVALLKREGLEHRSFVWAPLSVLAMLILASVLGLALMGTVDIQVSETTTRSGDSAISLNPLAAASLVNFFDFNGWTDRELAQYMEIFRTSLATPFQIVYVFVLLFVLLGTVHDERKDRSVLFWKSMPVSDLESIASKIILAVWIAPVITIAAIVIAQIFLLTMVSGVAISEDLGDVGRLWWQSGLLIGTVQLFVGYFIQGFWALPMYAWLLLVSATANKTPILWAVLVPFVPIILERMLFGTSIIFNSIGNHLQFVALPSFASDVDERIFQELPSLADQLSLFLTTDLWLGVIVGAALLYATVYFRSRFNEI